MMTVVVCDAIDAPVTVVCQATIVVVLILTGGIIAVIEVERAIVVQCLGIVRNFQQAVAVIGNVQAVDGTERAVILHAVAQQGQDGAVGIAEIWGRFS